MSESIPRMMPVSVLVGPGRIEVHELPVPRPGAGELLVRVDAALTCGTDVKTYRRGHPKIPLPAPLGHEFAGTVAAVGGGVTGFAEGDALASVHTAPCAQCALCRRGRENLCATAMEDMVLGAFAPFLLLPARLVRTNVFQRPAGMSAVTAAALEPLSCVMHGASRVPLADAATVAILGDGPIALLFLQVARACSAARVALAGRHEVRLRAARELGADRVVRADEGALGDPLAQALRELGAADGADIAIECVGSPETWERALSLTAPGGTALLFGGCPADTRAAFDTYRIHYEEVDVRGAFHFTRRDVRAALELLSADAVRIEPLVTHRLPLDELETALDLVLRRQAIKVALCPDPRPPAP